jgi:hypothetical protein
MIKAKIKLETFNFLYYSDVEYDTEYECQNGSDCCDNDYCRCGQIVNERLTRVPDILTEYQRKKHFDPPTKLRVWDLYCIDRLLVLHKAYDPDSYYIKVVGGYYGQEIGSVTLNCGKVLDEKINHVLSLPKIEKIKYVLNEEYGYILPELEGKNFKVQKVKKDRILFGQKEHYKDIEHTEYYETHDLPRGICVADGKMFRVLDGYHRLKAASCGVVDIIVAGDKSR